MTGVYDKGDIKMKNRDSYSDKDNNRYRIVNADPATTLKHIKNSYLEITTLLSPSFGAI